ncbi:MAG: 5-oxoprolinase subunit PxpB [Bacteroidota bacterium]
MTIIKNAIESAFSIYYLSERAVTVEFGHEISEHVNIKVRDFNNLIHSQPFPGFITMVPAYASVTVFYDPVLVSRSSLTGSDCFEKVSIYLNTLKPTKKSTKAIAPDTIIIPICYDISLGPDLDGLAKLHQINVDEVIRLHSAAIYQVYMIGFVPGFAYLGGMDPLLNSPRKSTPRKAVPAGSVGIAGEQTGIYPLQTPGGWQIIGQTPLKMFDIDRPQPSLLKAGDRVIFKPIPLHEFKAG